MVIFDTETTGLTLPEASPLDKQPRIIEFAGIILDDKSLKEVDCLEFLVDPGIPISSEITRITGIKQGELNGKPSFGSRYEELCNFFLGQRVICAHNLDFDTKLLQYDLTRIGKQYAFPWPPRRICTVEASMSVKGRRAKLGELYELATGQELKNAHRAINDVRGLGEVVRWLKSKNLVRI